MANEGGNEGSLKEKLRELMDSIAGNDNTSPSAIDEAIEVLKALKDNKYSSILGNSTLPPEFRCPISGRFITDPVFLTNKETYDRSSIEKWMKDVTKLCDQTKRILSDCTLTPNNSAQRSIAAWCEENRLVLDDSDYAKLTEDHKHQLHRALYELSLSEPEQKEAANRLRQLTARIPPFRQLLGNREVIHLLLSPLSIGLHRVHPQIHEDLVTIILNASILEDNRNVFGEDEKITALLIETLRLGTIEAKSNAATAIFLLSTLETNKLIFGTSDVLKNLVELLDVENELATKNAASALFSLCLEEANRALSVEEGIVEIVVSKIINHVQVEDLMSLLVLLTRDPNAVVALAANDTVPLLLSMLRENTESIVQEYSISILHAICKRYPRKLDEVNEEELEYGSLSSLAEHGTPKAKKIAITLLHLIE